MTNPIWVDAQLPPALARWFVAECHLAAHHLEEQGPPPRVVWVTCGNRSNADLIALFAAAWPRAATLLAGGEPLVEIGGG